MSAFSSLYSVSVQCETDGKSKQTLVYLENMMLKYLFNDYMTLKLYSEVDRMLERKLKIIPTFIFKFSIQGLIYTSNYIFIFSS